MRRFQVFAASIALAFLVAPIGAETSLEQQSKEAFEAVQGPAAGKAPAPSKTVGGGYKYGKKQPPAARQPAKQAAEVKPVPSPTPTPLPDEKRQGLTTGEVVGSVFLLLFGLPLLVGAGAHLMEEDLKRAPLKKGR